MVWAHVDREWISPGLVDLPLRLHYKLRYKIYIAAAVIGPPKLPWLAIRTLWVPFRCTLLIHSTRSPEMDPWAVSAYRKLSHCAIVIMFIDDVSLQKYLPALESCSTPSRKVTLSTSTFLEFSSNEWIHQLGLLQNTFATVNLALSYDSQIISKTHIAITLRYLENV